MAYVITGQCIDELDGSCVDSCPVDCIYEGERKRYINPDECIDCGACLPECPVDAIIAPGESPDPVWDCGQRRVLHPHAARTGHPARLARRGRRYRPRRSGHAAGGGLG